MTSPEPRQFTDKQLRDAARDRLTEDPQVIVLPRYRGQDPGRAPVDIEREGHEVPSEAGAR